MFARKLPTHYQRALDQLRPSLRATSQRSPGWEDVVGIARDELTGALLLTPEATAAPKAAPINPPSSKPGAGTGPCCDLCERSGLPSNHRREYCFIDPGSKAYKPDVRAKRLADAARRGIKVPQDVLDMAPLPAQNAVLPGPVADLTGALKLAGNLDDSYVDQIVEAVLELEQSTAGEGVNSVTHLEDGEIAGIIAAVGTDPPRRSLLEQLQEGGLAAGAIPDDPNLSGDKPLAERIADIISERVPNLVAPTS